MSRKRREIRDAAKGDRFVNRIVITRVQARGGKAEVSIDCGGLPAKYVAIMLRNLAASMDAEIKSGEEKLDKVAS